MGYAVPAAMGAKVGRPDTTVWAIDGDGCFQMTNQELATCAINDIPIKVAIINNESLGMVRQWQTLFYDERYSNTDLDSPSGSPTSSSSPRPTAASGLACDSPGDVDATIEKAMEINDVPVVVDFRVAPRRDGVADGRRRHAATTRSSTPATSRPSSTRTTTLELRDSRGARDTHTLSVLVENKPGVLARIAGLFSRRGFNIESLAVGPTEHPEISRMTIVVNVEDSPLEQVTKQLNKLVKVIKIVELDGTALGPARAAAGQGRADADTRGQVLDAVQLFRAKVVDVAPDAVTIEVTGNADKLERLPSRCSSRSASASSCSPAWSRSAAARRSITERTLRPIAVPVATACGRS